MRRIAVVLIYLAALASAGSASAAPGSWTDPKGDAGGSPIDIVAGSHGDTSTAVTWTIRTDGGFTNDDVDVIVWGLYFGASTAEPDACVVVFDTGSALDGEVDDCGQRRFGDASVSHSDGSTTLTVSAARSVLSAAGLRSSSYRYEVYAAGFGDYDWEDVAPNSGPVTHTLNGSGGGGGSPTPAPGGPTARTSTPAVAPGQQVTVSGEGFQPAAELTITFRSDPVVVGRTTARANGSYSARVTIPSNAAVGMHTLEVSGLSNGQNRTASTPIRVVAAASRSGSDDLPASGAPLTQMATWGFMLITGGEVLLGGALWATWPRRRETAPRTALYPEWEAWESWQDRTSR